MPLIVLKYDDQGKKYVSIWCEEVPPPVGGGPGRLVIPNVERKHNAAGNYDYLYIPRVGDENNPKGNPPEDICIELGDVPNTNNGWVFPYNGAPLSDALSIPLKTCPHQ